MVLRHSRWRLDLSIELLISFVHACQLSQSQLVYIATLPWKLFDDFTESVLNKSILIITGSSNYWYLLDTRKSLPFLDSASAVFDHDLSLGRCFINPRIKICPQRRSGKHLSWTWCSMSLCMEWSVSGAPEPTTRKIVALFTTLISIVMGLVTKPRWLAEKESRQWYSPLRHPRVQRVLRYSQRSGRRF